MLESNREYGSPSYLSDSLKSRDHHNGKKYLFLIKI